MSRATNRSQATLLAATLAGLTISLALTTLLGRVLPPQGFGFVALVGAILVLARDLTDLGSGNVAAALIAPAPLDERTVLEDLLGIRLVLAGVVALACAALALSRTNPGEEVALGITAAAVLLFHLSALSTVFQVRQAQGGPSIISVAGQLVALSGSLALAAAHAAASIFALLFVARDATVALGVRALAIRRLGYTPRPRLRSVPGSILLRRSASYALAALCYSLAVQGSPLLVGLACPPEELGAFAAAFRPMAPLLSLPWLLATPLVPALAALASAETDMFAARAGSIIQIALGLGATIAVAGQVLAEPMLGLVYNGHFVAGPLAAVTSLRWLAVALGAICVIAAATATLLAVRRVADILALAIGCLVLDAVISAITLPRIVFDGAAVAIALATLTVAGVAVFLAIRQGARPASGIHALSPLVPAAALGVADWLMPADEWLRLGFGGIATLFALAAAWGLVAAGNHQRLS